MLKKKMAYQLTAGFVAIVLIAMLILGGFFIRMFHGYAVESRKTTMLDRAHSIAGIMAETVPGGNGFRGMGGFMRFLNTMTDSDVWILDANGDPWVIEGKGNNGGGNQSQFVSQGPLPTEATAIIAKVMGGEDSVSEGFSSVYNEATLTVGTPIMGSDSQVAGVVLLNSPVADVALMTHSAIKILLISLGAALLAAIALGMAYSQRFTRPLKEMNRVAMAMAEGDYDSRADLHRQDELGQLGDSLDKLAGKLGSTMDLLYQEKGKLSDIIASISEGILSFDAHKNLLSTNGKLIEIMGYEDMNVEKFIVADFENLDLNGMMEQVMEEKRSIQAVRVFKGKHLKFTLSPIVDNHRDVTGIVALVQDISESERLEQLRRDFVANVSHEFRTPLTVIKGSLEALADGTVTEPESVSRYYTRLQSETRALERLVGDLLDLSRLQAETLSLHLEPVNMSEVITDALKGIQAIAQGKGIEVVFHGEEAVPPVMGDYDRLRQLFIIFLDNAVKYSTEKSTVRLSLHSGERVDVTIEDQGPGISTEELPYIWDRFYQGDASRESHGTGLGLSIAARLIALHGGTANVSSHIGKGTVFTLTFPIKKD